MKQQLQNWQNIEHMFNNAKNQSTIVKTLQVKEENKEVVEEIQQEVTQSYIKRHKKKYD